MIILSSLEKALLSLDEALQAEKNTFTRDSAIQRFEYTYELSIKMLKRILEQSEPSKTTIDEMGFRDLMRLAAEKGYIGDPATWFAYRESRNITSHAYDEAKAEAIYAVLPAFAHDANSLLAALQKANV